LRMMYCFMSALQISLKRSLGRPVVQAPEASSSSVLRRAWLMTAPLDDKQSGRAQPVLKQQETSLLSTSEPGGNSSNCPKCNRVCHLHSHSRRCN
jgi:hypothetical protein